MGSLEIILSAFKKPQKKQRKHAGKITAIFKG